MLELLSQMWNIQTYTAKVGTAVNQPNLGVVWQIIAEGQKTSPKKK
jgi:hypothetical protein